MRANRMTLMDTPSDDPVYDTVVQRVAESNGRIAAQLIRHHAQLRAEVQAVMTADQRERARALRLEMRDAMERRIEQRLSGQTEMFF